MNNKDKSTFQDNQKPITSSWLFRGLLIAFIISASITANIVYRTAKDFVTGTITRVSGPLINDGQENGVDGILSESPPNLELDAPEVKLTPWDGSSRVTILIMGLDARDWEANSGPPRTDTMMLLTFDPKSKTAGMLSIPRDLWVDIPGFGHGKINQAYQHGEGAQLPGRGPGLAIKTVEQFLGITINYYAQIDFDAFVRFIDEIGGVKVTVKKKIKISIIGQSRVTPLYLYRGRQTLSGKAALAYARTRSTPGGDFDRAERQQDVIFGIRHKLLKANVQQHMLTNGLAIYQDLAGGIDTNMTFDEAIQLGFLAQQVGKDNIKRGVIAPPKQVTLERSPNDLAILRPVPQEIRILRDEIFSTTASRSQAALSLEPGELLKQEAANIAVFNGTQVDGLASTTQDYLISLGFNIVDVGNGDQVTFTKIIDYTGNPYTVQLLVDLMGIQRGKIFSAFDPNSTVDVEINIGPDWQLPGT